MVKKIVSHKYPKRISKFKKVVNEVWSNTDKQKHSQRIFLSKYSSNNNESNLWLTKDPERWEKFQKDFQMEFEGKIQLMDKIRDKKKENETFYLLQAGYFF
ncbi:MAG: hypothetical protein QM396_05580 [Euryarchaeota archaeon]|jgi:uncharacterized protein YeaO (DUF488 family)|uniref:hypothetical protein n=1 Tax=Methanobacterium sp. MZD130B TaxID=3394378 RepID=UPI0009D1BAC5|nr:hypothetical protein [Euryarchaeota archaeon]OPZ92986.1 MAG: hypothetical protein BWY74_01343 [Firmicutes bacterium ADurb.Bin419]HHT18655.1 hypothetical protein [Methanobacterium sp.]